MGSQDPSSYTQFLLEKTPFSLAVGGCSDAQGTQGNGAAPRSAKISTSGKITKIMSMD